MSILSKALGLSGGSRNREQKSTYNNTNTSNVNNTNTIDRTTSTGLDATFLNNRDNLFNLLNSTLYGTTTGKDGKTIVDPTKASGFKRYIDPTTNLPINRFEGFGTDILGTGGAAGTGIGGTGGSFNMIRNMMGKGQAPGTVDPTTGVRTGGGTYYNAMDTATDIMGRKFDPIRAGTIVPGTVDPVTGKTIAPTVSDYMNPYQDQVIDRVKRDYMDAEALSLRGEGARARANRAFGGERHAQEENRVSEQNMDSYLDAVSGIRERGFDRATGLMTSDLNRRLSGDVSTGNLGLGTGQLNLAGSGAVTDMFNNLRNAGFSDAEAMTRIGMMIQGEEQKKKDFDFGEFSLERDDPMRKLMAGSGILSSLPYGTTGKVSGSDTLTGSTKTTGSGTNITSMPSQRRNPMTGALGGALGGLGMAGATGLLGKAGMVSPWGWALPVGMGLMGAMS